MVDLHGDNLKYRLLRRILRPLIQRHVAVSNDLGAWLTERVRIPEAQVSAICNGVDTDKFHPADGREHAIAAQAGDNFGPDKFLIGTIGRLDAVKDQATLIRAFARLITERPALAQTARLVIIGDGPLHGELRALLEQENLLHLCWLPGSRDDIPALLRSLDLFVLPSLNEGISNTILEAMASGLPVVATDVGGNPELVVDGETGRLVPPADPAALAGAIEDYMAAPGKAAAVGRAARQHAERDFSLKAMVAAYTRLYDGLMKVDI
jgi:sugar transferase (PEP-CTERM/EpsH1 system associated)